jgi:transcriptional regulator with XRE-family HTH domain
MKHFLAKLKEIRDRTGLTTLRKLEDAGIGSTSALSRYFKGQQRIPDDVLKALCERAEATAELKQLKTLRDEAFSSSGRTLSNLNRGEHADRAYGEESSGARGGNEASKPLVSGTASATANAAHRRRRKVAFTAGIAALVLVAGLVIIIVRPWSNSEVGVPSPPDPTRVQPGVTPSACPGARKYEVTMQGNIVNDTGTDIGDVFPKDVFIVDPSSGRPHLQNRLYGTVEERGVSGYVLSKKLSDLSTCA